ncbi:MAG TPA: ABC transporter ATP-binding protein [Thermomicrobiales bacterium]|jgi:ABC-2 type transport system ATP-binding protein|nr:ABC transporter ATP-binding protein [Thermomicrobiales bacterium]
MTDTLPPKSPDREGLTSPAGASNHRPSGMGDPSAIRGLAPTPVEGNPDAPVLRVTNLTRRFGDITAVNNLTFEVRAGEVLGFLGPNGSGKSTTVSMILGLVRPTSGNVELYGHDVQRNPEVVAKSAGAIIENPAFYPYLSGRDNLRTFAKALGGVSDARVDELLELVRMKDRAGDKYKSYSLGMKQRLGIALTLLQNPGLVILDEPTNGLDPAGQREIRDFIPELARNGHAVLLASHLLHEVENVSDRVVIIRRGEMIQQGRVRDLVRSGGVIEVMVQPDEVAPAVDLIRRVGGVTNIQPGAEEGGIIVSAEPQVGRDINRMLAGQGIFASAVAPKANTLENVFLELTQGSAPGEQESGRRKRRFGRG